MNTKIKGGLISLFVGILLWVLLIYCVLWFLVFSTNETLLLAMILQLYGYAIIGLLIALVFALFVSGFRAVIDIQKKLPLLVVSFRYSLIMNVIIWFVFIIVAMLENGGSGIELLVLIPIELFLFSTVASFFSIGLLMSYLIRKSISKNV